MSRTRKSQVVNGFSYHFNDDKLIGIVNNADSAYPKALDPKSDLFARLAAEEVALAKYNILKYGGNIDAYEDSIGINPTERLVDYFNKQVKAQDNANKDLKQNTYPNVNDGISNPSLAFQDYQDRTGPAVLSETYSDNDGLTKSSEIYTYPLDIDPNQDHLKITRYEYKRNSGTGQSGVQGSRPPRAEPQYENFTFGENLNRFGNFVGLSPNYVERRKIGYLNKPGDTMLGNRVSGSVLLPMPKVVDTNGAEWGESELNIFGLGAVSAAGFLGDKIKSDEQRAEALGISVEDFRAQKRIQDRLKKNPDKTSSFGDIAGAIGSATMTEAIARTTGQTVTQDQVLARTGGQVLNPNAEMLFQGPVLRDFNFDFLMIARSREEGAEIRKIIRWLKSGMAPKFQSATFLKTPDIFTLEYKNGPGGNDVLKTVNRFSPGGLALRTIAVDYATNGYWSAYQDSQPVAVKMSMNFAELRPIYSQDQNHEQMEGSVGY